MRDISRIRKVTNELAKTWETPALADMRFGQFISNFMGWVLSKEEHRVADIWFPEEDRWLELLREYRIEMGGKE